MTVGGDRGAGKGAAAIGGGGPTAAAAAEVEVAVAAAAALQGIGGEIEVEALGAIGAMTAAALVIVGGVVALTGGIATGTAGGDC